MFQQFIGIKNKQKAAEKRFIYMECVRIRAWIIPKMCNVSSSLSVVQGGNV